MEPYVHLAMVTDTYQHIRHHDDVDELSTFCADSGLTLVGVDNFPDSVPIEGYALPSGACLLFGQEGPGLTEEARSACEVTLSIVQFGSTRSINAGAAAAIAMHAWIRQHAAAH
jgi:tRNA G18 (ribose-2'-O)-methylase SpoU